MRRTRRRGGGRSPTGNDDDGRDGAMRLSFPPLSVLFGSENAKDYWRREYKQFLGDKAASGKGATIRSAVSFWTKDRALDDFAWELVEHPLQLVDLGDVELVRSVEWSYWLRCNKLIALCDSLKNAH